MELEPTWERWFSPQGEGKLWWHTAGTIPVFSNLPPTKEEDGCGRATSLYATILFHGWYCPFPFSLPCEVDLESWLVLLIWGWVRPICHLVSRGKWGGTFFNCQVTWRRDRRSFGHIVRLCVKDWPSEIPHLIMRKGRLIDQFTNWQPQD